MKNKIKNALIDVTMYANTDNKFVEFFHDGKDHYGFIHDVDVYHDRVRVRHMDSGGPSEIIQLRPSDGNIRLIDRHDAVNGFKEISNRIMENDVKPNECLYGAFRARDLHFINLFIKGIIQEQGPVLALKNARTGISRTGLYVARGWYITEGYGMDFEGVQFHPRVPEESLSSNLKAKFPKGFGKIKHQIGNSAVLTKYQVHEVPEFAKKSVKNPRKLIISDIGYGVS